MAIEFRDLTVRPLVGFEAQAPARAMIGLLGEQGSGIPELLKVAAAARRDDVIVVDHSLALQDGVARARTLIELEERRCAGATILLASHDTALLETTCDEIWWLRDGHLAFKGDPKEAVARYRRYVADCIRGWAIPARLAPSFRRGDGRAEIVSIETLGASGEPTMTWKSGEKVSVRAAIGFHETVDDPVFGLMIRTQIGFEVYGTNTELEKVKTGRCAAGDSRTITFAFRCELCPRAYTLTLASHDADGTAHDWLEDAVAVTVVDDRYTAGVANLRAEVSVTSL